MRRLWWLGLVVAVAGLTGVTAPALAGPAGPLISCESGFEVITNYNIPGGITSHGRGYDLTQSNPAGSCWKAIWPFHSSVYGGTGYQYENESGECMWNYGDFPQVASCDQGDSEEQYVGVVYISGRGWNVGAENPANYEWEVYGCVGSSAIILQNGGLSCGYWNFG